ncbi:MAG TPA: hypothetical protein IAB48_12865 [Candidatus Fimimorpha excrementavium]|nr:hypothetical protein [Candidatus Fimimorpha excrementavium]
MKKITAFLLAVLLIAAGMLGFSGTTSKAASASFSVSIDNASAPVGSTITVTVTFNTDVQATASFSLAYDGNVLSPNGSTNGLFEDSATGTTQSFSFTVTGSGSTAITASGSGATLGSAPGPLPVSSGSASFSGTAASQPTDPPTTEPAPTDPPATEPPTTPAPTPETEPPTPEPTVPTAPQPSTPDQAAIDASIAESIAESIRASEAEAESIRNSIAAAEAASREESLRAQDELNNTAPETTEETTDETTETADETAEEETNLLETEQESAAVVALSSMLVDGKATTIDGKSLELAESLENITLPDGYTLSNITLGDQVYEVAKGENGLILYYLMDGENGEFYLFDDDENVFYPFVSITSGSETYVILKPGKNIKIPGNLERVDLSIDGKPVSAWQPEENTDPSIYVVFAADSKGQRGFYRYNETDGSLTPYSTANTDDGDTATSSGASAGQTSATTSSDDSLFTILKVLGCVVAILIIALIVVLVLRSRSRKPEDGGNGPDSDYEDDEDYEDDGLMDFDNPMFSDIQSEVKNNRSQNTQISSDTMDLFDVQDIEQEPAFDQNVSKAASSNDSNESVSAADNYSQPESTDSMIDMEALSKALSDVRPEDTVSSKPIGNTQKLEAINRELDEELSGSRNQAADDDDDFDVTKFDD